MNSRDRELRKVPLVTRVGRKRELSPENPKCQSPEIPTLVGESCAVGPRGERLEVRESRVGEGSKCENLRGPKP
jgi:hypothetical protein